MTEKRINILMELGWTRENTLHWCCSLTREEWPWYSLGWLSRSEAEHALIDDLYDWN